MITETPEKLEIFLMLALRLRAGGQAGEAHNPPDADDSFTALDKQLPAPQAEELRSLLASYEKKSETEKQGWRERIEKAVGGDEPSIDDSIHWSHVEAALSEEPPAVRETIMPVLPEAYRSRFDEDGAEIENSK